MPSPEFRHYQRDDVIAFRRTGEAFGGLSNMAPGFPLAVNGLRIRTAEALYQACRFPHLPRVQRMILDEISPMTAKMRGKPYRADSRADWDAVRVPIMKWCLRVKLACNWEPFSALLLATDDRAIVEDSAKDAFWGAMPEGDSLHGCNVLGRLLMDLREGVRSRPDSLRVARPLPIEHFVLLEDRIGVVTEHAGDRAAPEERQAAFI